MAPSGGDPRFRQAFQQGGPHPLSLSSHFSSCVCSILCDSTNNLLLDGSSCTPARLLFPHSLLFVSSSSAGPPTLNTCFKPFAIFNVLCSTFQCSCSIVQSHATAMTLHSMLFYSMSLFTSLPTYAFALLRSAPARRPSGHIWRCHQIEEYGHDSDAPSEQAGQHQQGGRACKQPNGMYIQDY